MMSGSDNHWKNIITPLHGSPEVALQNKLDPSAWAVYCIAPQNSTAFIRAVEQSGTWKIFDDLLEQKKNHPLPICSSTQKHCIWNLLQDRKQTVYCELDIYDSYQIDDFVNGNLTLLNTKCTKIHLCLVSLFEDVLGPCLKDDDYVVVACTQGTQQFVHGSWHKYDDVDGDDQYIPTDSDND